MGIRDIMPVFGKKKDFEKPAGGIAEKPKKEESKKSPESRPVNRREIVKLPPSLDRELGKRDEGLEESLNGINEKIKNLSEIVALLISEEGKTNIKNSSKGVRKARSYYNDAQTYLSRLNALELKPRYEAEINNSKRKTKEIIIRLSGLLPKIVAAQNKIMAVKSKEDLENLVKSSQKEVKFISEKVGTEELPDFDAEDDLLLEIRPDLLKRKSNEIGAEIEKTTEYGQLQKFSQEAKASSWF